MAKKAITMNKKLREAVKKAQAKLNEADCAVQSISKYLTFCHFGGDVPNISSCNGTNELILKYHGREMPIEDVVERMEEYGYITPDDFV